MAGEGTAAARGPGGRPGPLRVVVADDEFLVRRALQDLVRQEDGWELAGVGGDLEELLVLVRDTRPDVVVTDIRMPPDRTDEGIRAARSIRREFPQVGVVVLSHHAHPGYVQDLLREGTQGRGYLLKQHLAHQGQLREAVLAVASGGSYVDAEVVRRWAVGSRPSRSSRVTSLTPRERQVLGAMAAGRTNAAIAAELVITEKAVQKHVNSIFAKLAVASEPGTHGRVAAVLAYLQDAAGPSDDGPMGETAG